MAILAAGLLFVLPIDWGRRQFTVIGVVLCVVGVAVMANVVGLV